MAKALLRPHLGQSPHPHRPHSLPLQNQPYPDQPSTLCNLPKLPATGRPPSYTSTRSQRSESSNILWQGSCRPRFRRLLYHRAIIHSRDHDAAAHSSAGHSMRPTLPCQAISFHGTSIYGYVLRRIWACRALRHEPHAGLVFQYLGHVRGFPA